MVYEGNNLDIAPSPAFAMAIYPTGVEFGIHQSKSKYDSKNLIELYIFNKNCEYRFIKNKSTLIENKDENKDYYIDEYMLFFGEKFISNKNGKTVLEDKGNKKEFFLDISKQDFGKGIYLGVRNYLDYDENGMVKVCNYRLTGLYIGEERKYLELNELDRS